MDELSLVQICCSWYSEEEIECAKSCLCELAGVRKNIRKGDKKNASNISDIIKLLKETDNLPTFVAKDLNRLPSVTFDHLDVSSLLQTLATMKNDMMTFKNETKSVITKLETEITELKKNQTISSNTFQYTDVPSVSFLTNTTPQRTPVQISNAEANYQPKFSTVNMTQNQAPSFKQVLMSGRAQESPGNNSANNAAVDEDGFSQITRKRKRQRIENYQEMSHNKSRFQSRNKRGTNATKSLKAVEQTIPVYVSRFANECTETDIKNYLNDNGVKESEIETLKQKKETNFKSFKIMVTKKDLQAVLREDFWPESIVFRIFKRSNKNQEAVAVN